MPARESMMLCCLTSECRLKIDEGYYYRAEQNGYGVSWNSSKAFSEKPCYRSFSH